MAKLGLSVRDDPKKVVDVAGRSWGEPVNGLALSVLLTPKQDEDELIAVSVAIHNRSPQTQRLTTRGWLNFFHVSVTGPDGAVIALTPYGRELMKPERQPAASEVTLAPGEAMEADIPIGALFDMRSQLSNGRYRVQATCEANGGIVASNEIEVEA